MCHSAWREEKRYRCQREGEKFGDKIREVRERERSLTKSFMLHLVSYKINTRTAHSYNSKHTKAIGSTDFTILTGFLSQITIQFQISICQGTEWGEIAI